MRGHSVKQNSYTVLINESKRSTITKQQLMLLCWVYSESSPFHLCPTTQENKVGGGGYVSCFAQKRDICLLLESKMGAACWYLLWRPTCRLKEILCWRNESNLIGRFYWKWRSSCCADPSSCPGDVTPNFTGTFSIVMTLITLTFDLEKELLAASWCLP